MSMVMSMCHLLSATYNCYVAQPYYYYVGDQSLVGTAERQRRRYVPADSGVVVREKNTGERGVFYRPPPYSIATAQVEDSTGTPPKIQHKISYQPAQRSGNYNFITHQISTGMAAARVATRDRTHVAAIADLCDTAVYSRYKADFLIIQPTSSYESTQVFRS